MSQGSDQAPGTKESPRSLTTYSKHRVTEFRPELADHHHSSIERCIEEPSLPGLSSCGIAADNKRKRRRLLLRCGVFREIDRVLTTVIPRHDETALGIEDVPLDSSVRSRLHQDSPFCEMVQVGAHDWIVAARYARAHYMFLLEGKGSVLR
jgi:hypothetical protein